MRCCGPGKTRPARSAVSASAWADASRSSSPRLATSSTSPIDCWGGFIDKATPEELHTSERPATPLELAAGVTCPLYAAFGEEDQNPSPELAGPLTEAAAKSGHEVLAEVYEGAGHAFFADYRPSYRPEAAQRLWEHVVPFLDRYLRSGEGPPTA